MEQSDEPAAFKSHKCGISFSLFFSFFFLALLFVNALWSTVVSRYLLISFSHFFSPLLYRVIICTFLRHSFLAWSRFCAGVWAFAFFLFEHSDNSLSELSRAEPRFTFYLEFVKPPATPLLGAVIAAAALAAIVQAKSTMDDALLLQLVCRPFDNVTIIFGSNTPSVVSWLRTGTVASWCSSLVLDVFVLVVHPRLGNC